jgi:hypothetical protein
MGDTVPHMKQLNIQILDGGMAVPTGVRLPVDWFLRRRVVVRIEGRDYAIGCASGNANNCLIDTLRQSLHMICVVDNVRTELDLLHRKAGPTRITAGDFLEFEHHWRDIITLLSRYDQSEKPRVTPQTVRIVAVDLNMPGHGDVVGEKGCFPLYIARQNGNHFVPLTRVWGGSTASSSGLNGCAADEPARPSADPVYANLMEQFGFDDVSQPSGQSLGVSTSSGTAQSGLFADPSYANRSRS